MEVRPDDYDIPLLPEAMRRGGAKRTEATDLARDFFKTSDAAICYGPLMLISAGLVQDKHVTADTALIDELAFAGAIYEYKEVVVDGNLVTSRRPSDLPAFMREAMKMVRGKAQNLKAA
jgi:protease I